MFFKQISSFLFVILLMTFRESKQFNTFQALGNYALNIPNTQRLLINTNSDNLSLNGSKSGTQSTIIAIPLYIRNSMSPKSPMILELMSSLPMQSKDNARKVSDFQTIDVQKPNEFKPSLTFQRNQMQTQRHVKHSPRDEPQKTFRPQRDERVFKSESNGFAEQQKGFIQSQSNPSVIANQNQNQFSQSSDKITLLRAPVPQRYTPEEQRKQSLMELESILTKIGLNNRFNDMNNESEDEKSNTYSDDSNFETNVGRRDATNANTYRNYQTFDDKSEKVAFSSSQTDPESIDTNIRDENNSYYTKNDNKYQNQYNEYETNNRNNEFQYRSPVPYTRPQEKTTYASAYTLPASGNGYTSRPVAQKHNYDSYVTPKPYSGSSFSSRTNMYMPSTDYPSDYRPPISGTVNDSPHSGQPIPQSNHNYNQLMATNTHNNANTEPKTQMSPNYSNDYSTPEEDCFDENNDYKSGYSSQTNPKSDVYDMQTKVSERDNNYDMDDLDPSKLDLKIVHLPVSLLRRLIGNRQIGLPGFQ